MKKTITKIINSDEAKLAGILSLGLGGFIFLLVKIKLEKDKEKLAPIVGSTGVSMGIRG